MQPGRGCGRAIQSSKDSIQTSEHSTRSFEHSTRTSGKTFRREAGNRQRAGRRGQRPLARTRWACSSGPVRSVAPGVEGAPLPDQVRRRYGRSSDCAGWACRHEDREGGSRPGETAVAGRDSAQRSNRTGPGRRRLVPDTCRAWHRLVTGIRMAEGTRRFRPLAPSDGR